MVAMDSLNNELLMREIKRSVDVAFQEDIPTQDITLIATRLPNDIATASIYSREAGVFSGLDVVYEICERYQVSVTTAIPNGEAFDAKTKIVSLVAPLHTLLKVERTLLNFIQRLSGIATTTHRYVVALQSNHISIVDTRKTTPGFRYLEKQAVCHGGGKNHRFSLSDMVLIKENHLSSFDDLRVLWTHLSNFLKAKTVPIEIEVHSFDFLERFLKDCPVCDGIDYLMFDNFDMASLKQAIALCKREGFKGQLEVSGNMNLETIHQYRDLAIDCISIGRLTHSVKAIDFSLLIEDESAFFIA